MGRAMLRAQATLWRGYRGEGAQAVMVCSTAQGEGAGIAAALLARACASAGLKTALVDCDRTGRGDLQPLRKADSAITRLEALDVDFVVLPQQAQHDDVASVIGELRRSHAAIILAAPPVLETADVISIARHVEGAVLVVRLDATSQEKIREAASDLRHFGGVLAGVIATDARPFEAATAARRG